MDPRHDIIAAVRNAVREATLVFFAPITPRLWRFAASQVRSGGWTVALRAFFLEGIELLVAGRLDRDGRVKPTNGDASDRDIRA